MGQDKHLPRLCHIIESIGHIRTLTTESDFATFEKDWRSRLAAERAFEIISEASRHLPDDLKGRHPGVPWKEIAGIGNVLRHDYQEIEPDILWKVAHDDLPQLEKICRDELAHEQGTRAQP